MSQANRLLALLFDELPHRTDEIVEKVYGPSMSLSRVGARIFELKQKGHDIIGWKDKENRTLYWYQLRPVKNPFHLRSQTPSPEKPVTQGVLFEKKLSTPWD